MRAGWRDKDGRCVILLLANALFPVFAGLALGYVAGLRKIVDNVNLKSLIMFLMTFALPCALFSTISHTTHADLFGQTRLVLVLAVVYLVTFGAVFYFTRLDSSSDRAVMALTLAFPNATAVGLPLLAATYGAPGSVACASAIAIGAVTISPITLAILESATSPEHHSFAQRLALSLLKAVKRPVVWSPVLAIVVVLLRVSLPTYSRSDAARDSGRRDCGCCTVSDRAGGFGTAIPVYGGDGCGGDCQEFATAGAMPRDCDARASANGRDTVCRADLRDSMRVLWDRVWEGFLGLRRRWLVLV